MSVPNLPINRLNPFGQEIDQIQTELNQLQLDVSSAFGLSLEAVLQNGNSAGDLHFTDVSNIFFSAGGNYNDNTAIISNDITTLFLELNDLSDRIDDLSDRTGDLDDIVIDLSDNLDDLSGRVNELEDNSYYTKIFTVDSTFTVPDAPVGTAWNLFNVSGSIWTLAETTTSDLSNYKFDLSNNYNEFIDFTIMIYNTNTGASRGSAVALYFYDASNNNILSEAVASFGFHRLDDNTTHRVVKFLPKNHSYKYFKLAWRGESVDIRWGNSGSPIFNRRTTYVLSINRFK